MNYAHERMVAATTSYEWQSAAALAEVVPRMRAIAQRVEQYEMPLLEALETEYADKIASRGWLVCGPAALTLMHLLQEDYAIPIMPDDENQRQERLSVRIYVFNPHDQPALPPRLDHTVLHYDTGAGFTLTFDPIYQLLGRGAAKAPGATICEWHYNHALELPGGHVLDIQGYWGFRLTRVLQSVRTEVPVLLPAERSPQVRLSYL